MPTPELNRNDLLDALGEVAAIMHSRGQRGRVYVVGGAAMMLAYSADRATQDIDAAIEEGYSAVTDAARIVAEQRGWPRSWLNEGATVYMPRPDQRHGTTIFGHPALTVVAATAEHMLAMKAKAARPTDRQDVEALMRQHSYTHLAQVEAVVQATFPDEPLGPRQQQWIAAIIDDLYPTRQSSGDDTGLSIV
ncbi:MAG: DUF6036 family nucleotidyltransferase [Acidimicrobiaceae bacterium]|nr:DUF6036 family nucleotidyltransferase [Acidimicrobiaceae bacterium]